VLGKLKGQYPRALFPHIIGHGAEVHPRPGERSLRLDRKRARCWAVAVLPALLLRSLIPVGFMPMFGPGMSVQLSLCEDYAPIPPPASDAAMDMPTGKAMDMPMAAPAQRHSTGEPQAGGGAPRFHQKHSACPYAASSTLAAQSTSANVATAAQSATRLPLRASQVARIKITPRAQSARGPPSEV